MPEFEPGRTSIPRRSVRWWPGILIVSAAVAAIVWVRTQTESPFQERNLTTAKIVLIAIALLGLWWTVFSRTPARLRVGVILGLVGLIAVGARSEERRVGTAS